MYLTMDGCFSSARFARHGGEDIDEKLDSHFMVPLNEVPSNEGYDLTTETDQG
jgi:hypothetical protein